MTDSKKPKPTVNRFGLPAKPRSGWTFGGRDANGDVYGGDKPQKDAERRAGKSRKVH